MKRVRTRLLIAGVITVMMIAAALPVYASPSHEDPEATEQIFSGISLLKYYSGSLDLVLQKNPQGTATYLEKMPFANVPGALVEVTGKFAQVTVGVSQSVTGIFVLWDQQRDFTGQFRLDDARQLSLLILARIENTRGQIDLLKQSVLLTGDDLGLREATPGSALRQTFDEVIEKISRIRDMLDLVAAELERTGQPEVLLQPTGVTLELSPRSAFVGDEVSFSGVLTCQNEPLSGRDVDILLNTSQYITVGTDAAGRYQGKLSLPFWYLSGIEVQALYHPQGEDIGRYLGSLSAPVTVQVQFYHTALDVKVDGKGYPGLDATFTGKFDYGQPPAPGKRELGIYVDDVFISNAVFANTFAGKVTIDPRIQPGKHVLTLSAPAAGRYSSAVASCLLEVIRATPVLDISIPRVAMIPGDIGLGGRLSSVGGPLNGAAVNIGMDRWQTQITTAGDGSFSSRLRVGMGLNFIGQQALSIQVVPVEPWNAPLGATRSIFMVNLINCGAILFILIFLGFYLPRRLMKRLGDYPEKVVRPAEVVVPQPTPAYVGKAPAPAVLKESKDTAEEGAEPRGRIYFWYRVMVRLIMKLFDAVFRPQQTLREFARENGRFLGPAGRYFMDLTLVVEKAFYGPREPSAEDAEKSQRLSQSIRQEITSEDI